MKCSHPLCNRGIGLVLHRGWFGKGLYCSRRCRDNYATVRTSLRPPLSADAKLFAWLLAPLDARAHPPLASATVRAQRRQTSF
jgi:hypothetical protein